MKVYGEYYEKSNGEYYRRKTLLQFGDKINLIGSAVLINPGSSNPIGNAQDNLIKSFYLKNHNVQSININVWKRFAADPTMLQLAKLFNGWYLGDEKPLNGVIQLFNCFYIKEQDLDKAIAKYKMNDEMVFNESHLFNDKPVYFGWGNTGKFGEIKNIATDIFKNYDINKTPIYDKVFENNCFYHPGYLNRSYKKNAKSIEIIENLSKVLNKK